MEKVSIRCPTLENLRPNSQKKELRVLLPLMILPDLKKPKSRSWRLLTFSKTPKNTPVWGPRFLKVSCLWDLLVRERPLWPKRWLEKRKYLFFRYRGRNSWKCSSVWVHPEYGIFSSVPKKRPQVSFL